MKTFITNDDSVFQSLLPIFATREYLSLQSKEFGWFVNDDFAMPWYITTKFGFRSLRITASPVLLGRTHSLDDEQCFLDAACRLSEKELRVDRITQPQNNAIFQAVPDDCVFAPFGTLFVPLKQRDSVDLFAGIHSKHRNVIRKAERDGVNVVTDDVDVGACIDLFCETMARQHMSSPSVAYFESLLDTLDGQVLLASAIRDDVLQGCALIPWNHHGAYYFWGGSIERPYGGSLNLLHWRIMEFMRERGVDKYDFVGARLRPEPGSKPESIQRFKERFGATFMPGYLWKRDCKPWRIRALTTALSAKALLSGRRVVPDLIDQERLRLRVGS